MRGHCLSRKACLPTGQYVLLAFISFFSINHSLDTNYRDLVDRFSSLSPNGSTSS